MSTNPIIQDLLNIGSVNDEYHTMVLNGLHQLRKNIAGLSVIVIFCLFQYLLCFTSGLVVNISDIGSEYLLY